MNHLALDAPSIAYTSLSPILVILIAALIGVLVEAFVPRTARFPSQVGLSVVAIFGALIAVYAERNTREITAGGAITIDAPGLFAMAALLVFGLLATMLYGDRSLDAVGGTKVSHFVAEGALPAGSRADRALLPSDRVQTEVFPLALFVLAGMMVFVSTNNLLVMFVALEVFSLALYVIVGLNRRRRLLSQEAALKYFLLGSFGSGFFVFGVALIYGFSGSVDLRGVFEATTSEFANDSLMLLGLGLILVGLFFKAGIAPFHQWTPDVYQGSPTPLTAFMAAATKLAAFVALLRVLYIGFTAVGSSWQPVLAGFALISMATGALYGLSQVNLKRMLAYSSIAHAGFIMVAVLANTQHGVTASLFYLVTYGLSTVAAFACVSLIRRPDGEAARFEDWKGMGRRKPVLAAIMTILMLSMTGIPLTAGFIGKFQAFSAAIDAGYTWVVVIALLLSAVTAVFYLRLVVLMYFHEPEEDAADVVDPGTSTDVVIWITTALTVLFGIIPGPLLDLVAKATPFIG
ncbi:NADH-quinone oxidoreductase subunit NuoN [Blastococcus sp. Marseille-P5729]|uniref:NADH-quinone oxidoreductase subunit NuoN n=1 Tax=Blastococcus sp. Marseille-P5729 TaxID=2086582 RepID=UPI000D1047E1|nr:NADH-quinone oxidoreductase subunit NuoN [Blastococcus sp. Marseille-P5729]